MSTSIPWLKLKIMLPGSLPSRMAKSSTMSSLARGRCTFSRKNGTKLSRWWKRQARLLRVNDGCAVDHRNDDQASAAECLDSALVGFEWRGSRVFERETT